MTEPAIRGREIDREVGAFRGSNPHGCVPRRYTSHGSVSRAEVERKVMAMYTDPNRLRADIPGTVERNSVFAYHEAFNPNRDEVADLASRYRVGAVGDVEVKRKLAAAINGLLDPMRERRARYDVPGLIEDLIRRGTERVRSEAGQTLQEVRRAMGLAGVWDRLQGKAEGYHSTSRGASSANRGESNGRV